MADSGIGIVKSGPGDQFGPILPGWSSKNDATPRVIGNSSGSTGDFSFSTGPSTDIEFLAGESYIATHPSLGSVSGRVIQATSNGADLTKAGGNFSGGNALSPLSIEVVTTAIGERAFGTAVGGFRSGVGATFASTLTGIETDSAGNAYTIEANATGSAPAKIQKFGPSGALLLSFTIPTGDATGSVYYYPKIAVDGSQNIYVASSLQATGARVMKFNSSGVYQSTFGNTGTGSISVGTVIAAMSFSPVTGYLYIANAPSVNYPGQSIGIPADIVKVFNPATGAFVANIGAPGSGDGQFDFRDLPADIAIAPNGDIFVMQTFASNSRLTRFDSAGTFVSRVSISQAGPFSIVNPSSITVNSKYVYMTSGYNSTGIVRVFDYAGKIIAGNLVASYDFNVTSLPPAGAMAPYQIGGVTTANSASQLVRFVPGSNFFWVIDNNVSNAGTISRIQRLQYTESTLSSVLGSYFQKAGINSYSYTASTDPIAPVAAWQGDLWEHIKQLCSAYNVEIVVLGGVITVRDCLTATATLDNARAGSLTLDMDLSSSASSISVTNYQARSGSGTLWNSSLDNNVLSVDVNEVKTITIQTTNYPISILQPTRGTTIPVADGEYWIIANDNLPVVQSQWESYGGRVSVAMNTKTPGAIDITLTGPRAIPGVAGPFYFAASDGSTKYPQFSIVGVGIFTQPVQVLLPTGADPAMSPASEPRKIDNIGVTSLSRVYATAGRAQSVASGPAISLRATIPSVEIGQFGYSAGAVVSFRNAKYRIRTISAGNEWATLTLEPCTTYSDYDAKNPTQTYGQATGFWFNKKYKDSKIKPLL